MDSEPNVLESLNQQTCGDAINEEWWVDDQKGGYTTLSILLYLGFLESN